MVKVSLSGKKQTTTQALSARIARWIFQAGCGVMILIGGELVACDIVQDIADGKLYCFEPSSNNYVILSACRIYRDTVRQIKSLIGIA